MKDSPLTITQVVLATLLVFASLSLLVACVNDARETARRMQSGTQLRGIHQGLVVFANSNGNYYAGLDSAGEPATYDPDAPEADGPLGKQVGLNVVDRFAILLNGDYFIPEYPVSPSETDGSIQPWSDGPFTTSNYSYAMLQVPDDGGRYEEWGATLNSRAVVVADRNTGSSNSTTSIYSSDGWQGHVLWNDNHVTFEDTDTLETHYESPEMQANPEDKLFEDDGTDDALMVHSGN